MIKVALLFLVANAFSQSNNEALESTQRLLRDPAQRQKLLQSDPKAQKMDQKLEQTFGAQKGELYDISAELLRKLSAQAGNDPDKMLEVLQKYQSNPKAFYEQMSEPQKARIRKIANEVEKANSPLPSQPPR